MHIKDCQSGFDLMIMSEGLFRCDEHLYHALPLPSYSGLKRIIDHSPLAYRLDKDDPIKPTKGMRFGSLLHKCLEDIDDWHNLVQVAPQVNRRTNAGKETLLNWMADLPPHAMIATADEYEQIAATMENLRKKDFYDYIAHAEREVSGRFFSFDAGVHCKFRIDAISERDDEWALIDFKTSALPIDRDSFYRTAKKYRYNMQAALYSDGFKEIEVSGKPAAFYIMAFETTRPYDCALFGVSAEFLEMGRRDYKRGLEIYRTCMETNVWPGHAQHVQIL